MEVLKSTPPYPSIPGCQDNFTSFENDTAEAGTELVGA